MGRFPGQHSSVRLHSQRGASVKLFLPIFKMNFPELVDPAPCGTLPAEGVFHNLVFVSIRKTYPTQSKS